LDNKLSYILAGLILLLILYVAYCSFILPSDVEDKKEVKLTYEVPQLDLPDHIEFAGEQVPLEDPDVRERLDRELHVNTFWHSNTIFLLKRGHRWLSDIKRIISGYGIPADIQYLAVIESDLLNVVSPSNAVGFWQLLKDTAIEYGLEVNKEVDERYDPLKSTEAACKYLVKAHGKFGNWTNAAASYNIGMRGLQKGFDKQGVTSYYDLLLGEETKRYVFRAIAVKSIFEHPGDYGFLLDEHSLYEKEKMEVVVIDHSISNLADFAADQRINYKILKRHNPWLRKNKLTVRNGKIYKILIPVKKTKTTANTSDKQVQVLDTAKQ